MAAARRAATLRARRAARRGRGEEGGEEGGDGDFRFARRFTPEGVLREPGERRRFLEQLVRWEGHFVRPGAGVAASGLTYDGCHIQEADASLRVRTHSNPSKEALHLALLSLAVRRAGLAAGLLPPAEALRQLERKAAALEAFRAASPDSHGFMPWFDARGAGGPLEPCVATRYNNGLLGWSLYGAVRALREAGHAALADRLDAHLEEMRSWAVRLCYKGGGRVAAYFTPRPRGAEPLLSEQDCEDPFAGEVLCLFLDLLARWEGGEHGAEARDAIWSHPGRRRWLSTSVLELGECDGDGPGPAIEAMLHGTFSVHEEWKFLLLPYTSVPACRRLLLASERARTAFARARGLPGMLGDCHVPEDWRGGSRGGLEYVTSFGIPALSGLPADEARSDAVAASGPFALLLAEPALGAAWLCETLRACPDMQTPWGMAESCLADGSAACPLLTWDTKATTTLAALGGLGGMVRRFLEQDGLLARFERVLGALYSEFAVPWPLRGESLDFAPPPSVPVDIGGASREEDPAGFEREMVKGCRGVELPPCDERALRALRAWFERHEDSDPDAPYCTPSTLDDWSDWFLVGEQRFRAEGPEREELYRHVVAMFDLGIPLALLARQAPRYSLFLDLDIYGALSREAAAGEAHRLAWDDRLVLLRCIGAAVIQVYPQLGAGLEVAVFCSSGPCTVHGREKASYHLVFPQVVVDRPVKAWPDCPDGPRPATHGRHIMVVRDHIVRALIAESSQPGPLADLQELLLECCDELVTDSEGEEGSGGGEGEEEPPVYRNGWSEVVDDKPLRHEPWPDAFTGFRLPFTDKVAPATSALEGRPKVPLGRWLLRAEGERGPCGPRLSAERLPDLGAAEWVGLGDVSVCPGEGLTPWEAAAICQEAREEFDQLFE
ncbi:unnamed protein product [Prorocentrum cordatum]|uniref:Endo-beta-1,2-glucanase SGL domain-containing protein n=1 Tax=Prorocentrum cordatum TaxID=2364126 RepID=A0ABN9WS95_9DINO|nr:unnamed protein product [Polarella glacialis]